MTASSIGARVKAAHARVKRALRDVARPGGGSAAELAELKAATHEAEQAVKELGDALSRLAKPSP
jgi:hypothetical protein